MINEVQRPVLCEILVSVKMDMTHISHRLDVFFDQLCNKHEAERRVSGTKRAHSLSKSTSITIECLHYVGG